MSDTPLNPTAQLNDGVFNARTMLLITAIGILAFIAMLLLGAYAPDLRSGHNGGSHALSKGATGFAGIVRLADETGRKPRVIRSEHDWAWQAEILMVVTPDHGWTDLGEILKRRGPRTTLLVLPKWQTVADPQKMGWIRVAGLLPAMDPARTLYPATPLGITRLKTKGEMLLTVAPAAPAELHFLAPRVLQTVTSKQLEPLITNKSGAVVLGKIRRSQTYVLADPDLLNNHAMGDERQARAALAMLDYLNSTGANEIVFDVTANGLGHSRSPLKLAFDVPFLAVTLTIFAAMVLAGWQALVRFGPVRRPRRAIAFGKAALVDNSAALIRKAGRESSLGNLYVALIRERAMAMFRLPTNADPNALSARLESLNTHRSFASAAEAARDARTRNELLAGARSLHQWLEEVQK